MPPSPSESVLPQLQTPRFEYETGTVIANRYRLEVPIGLGAMGTVWRAHNELLDAPLALKLLRSNVPRSGSAERLLLEAKAAASLCHPAIVRVFDFGVTEQGDPFLAMELLQGESLRDLLEREHSLPAAQAVRLLLPILAGLTCAHARGIVHRDLKPDNIFLARDDAGCVEPKIVDFGIAKFEGASSRLTAIGVLLGSPSYMSPEQARGEEEDMRADVWAIAVVLYEAICGKAPWEAPSCPALLRAIVDDLPPPLVGIGGVDFQLWAVIERGLAKRREDRWSSSRDFGHALAVWLDNTGVVDDLSGTSLKTAWLADLAPGTVRASFESIPLIGSNTTVEQPSLKKHRKLTLVSGVLVVACLMMFQVGFRSFRAPAAPALVASNASSGSHAFQPGARPQGSIDRPPPPPTVERVAPAAARSSARLPIAVSVPSASLSGHAPAAKVPLARPGTARGMDFGF